MNSSELLRIKLANGLYCASNQISIGPTGATGAQGPAGVLPATSGVMKAYTIYVNYASNNAINKVYIPPGLFADGTGLQSGGEFTGDITGTLEFAGTSRIFLSGTTYGITCGILASGYTTSRNWSPVPYGNIQASRIYYSVPAFNDINITGLSLTNINGANTAIIPGPTDPLYGYLATITLLYI